MFEKLKLSDLNKNQHKRLRRVSSTRPTVWSVEENGIHAVVKDFSRNGFLFRNIVGRFLIWREAKAYNRLKGIENIPVLFNVLDGLALVIEEVDGKCVGRFPRGHKLPDHFFHEMKELVERIHSHGIAHCDLKTSTNTLITTDDHPCFIDWATSISYKEFRFFPLNLIYQRFQKDDFLGVIKLQLRHAPDTVSQENIEQLNHRGMFEKSIRSMKKQFRNFLQKVA